MLGEENSLLLMGLSFGRSSMPLSIGLVTMLSGPDDVLMVRNRISKLLNRVLKISERYQIIRKRMMSRQSTNT
jgi:hypothetical protein